MLHIVDHFGPWEVSAGETDDTANIFQFLNPRKSEWTAADPSDALVDHAHTAVALPLDMLWLVQDSPRDWFTYGTWCKTTASLLQRAICVHSVIEAPKPIEVLRVPYTAGVSKDEDEEDERAAHAVVTQLADVVEWENTRRVQ